MANNPLTGRISDSRNVAGCATLTLTPSPECLAARITDSRNGVGTLSDGAAIPLAVSGLVASELIAAYDFRSVSGLLPDVSGNGNAGTLAGSPLPAQTPGGLSFAGGYVALPAALWQQIKTVQIWTDFSSFIGTNYPTLLGSDQGQISLESDGMPTCFAPNTDLGNGLGMIPNLHLQGPNGLTWVLAAPESVYWNGTPVRGYVQRSNAPTLSAVSALHLGQWPGMGRPYAGTMYFAAFYSRALSGLEIEANHGFVVDQLQNRGVQIGNTVSPFASQILFDGDSLMRGAQSTYKNDAPAQIMVTLPQAYYAWTNLALGGQTIQQILAVAPVTVDTLVNQYFGRKTYVLWAGANDLGMGAGPWRSPAQVYGDLRARTVAALVAGWQSVVVLTVLPRATSNGSFAADRAALNAAIRGLAADVGSNTVYVADVAADPLIGPDGANLSSYYAVDHVHLVDSGYTVVAGIVKNVLASII